MSEEVSKGAVSLLASFKAEPVDKSQFKTETEERPESPESNCAICLEGFDNKSFTNSCLHEFCFLCLKEWSKIKPECPLCKQRFQTIIYNIRSSADYDEYHVHTPNPFEHLLLNFTSTRYPYSNALDYRERAIREREFSRGHLAASFATSMMLIRNGQGLRTHSSYLTFNDYAANVTFRRDVYRYNRWVRPSSSPRIREVSPEFYSENPAQTHRLVPWLFRELHVLLSVDVSIEPVSLLQEILNLVTLYPIRSRDFREAMQPSLGNLTDHFLHEFYHFAISPHDLLSYDIVAVSEYDPPGRAARCSPLRFGIFSDSDDSDVEVVQPPCGRLETHQQRGCVLDLTNRAGPSTGGPSSQNEEYVIEISDSSDSEVEIILVKPPSPVVITIDSSDSEEEVIEVSNDVESMTSVRRDEELVNCGASTSQENTSPEEQFPCSESSGSRSSRSQSSSTSDRSRSCSSDICRRRRKTQMYYRPSPSTTSSSSQSSSSSSSCSDSDSDSEYHRGRSTHGRKRKRVLRKMVLKKRKPRPESIHSSSDGDDYSHSSKIGSRLRSVVNRVKHSSKKSSVRQKNK